MERKHYIDWLRIIAIILVLFYHTAQLFAEDSGWHIKNNDLSNLWLEFNFFLSRFRMPLLFFISGYGSYLALRTRTAWRFTKERNNRLMIPLLFAMFVIIPPQIFFERIFNGSSFSFWEFYPSTFNLVPYPEGNFSWHHMWFVLYLFFYSLVGLPIFLFLRKENIAKRISNFIEKHRWTVYLFTILPTLLIFAFWTAWSDQTHAFINDWGYHPYWFSFFFAGYLAGIAPKIWDIVEEHRRELFGLAILCIVAINFVRWNDVGLNTFTRTIYIALLPLNTWFWLLSMVGFGKKYLNRDNPILAYANRAIYPFYILHQTIIIVIGYYVINLEESITAKYIFVASLSFFFSVAIYEYLIRPFRITRFLFGVKELPKKKKSKDFSNLEDRAEFKAA